MVKGILKVQANTAAVVTVDNGSNNNTNRRQSVMRRRGSAHSQSSSKENRVFNIVVECNSSGNVRIDTDKESKTDTENDYNYWHRPTKVMFSDITIYEFPNILGDNPATANGSPISIGWHHHSKNTIDVDFYEYMRCSSAACNPRRTRRQLIVRGGERDSYLLSIGYRLDELMDATDEVRKIRDSRLRNMKDSKWMKIVGVLDTVGKGVVNTTVDVGKGVFDVSKIIVIDGLLDGSVQVAKGTTKVAMTTSSFVAQGAITTTNFVTQGAISTTTMAVQGTTKAATEIARVTSNVTTSVVSAATTIPNMRTAMTA